MSLQNDFGLDQNGDLDIENGDLTYVLSDQQHIQDTIIACPLWWKQYPADGVCISNYRGSSGKIQQLMGAIKKQLQADGYSCANAVITTSPGGTLNINPNATRS